MFIVFGFYARFEFDFSWRNLIKASDFMSGTHCVKPFFLYWFFFSRQSRAIQIAVCGRLRFVMFFFFVFYKTIHLIWQNPNQLGFFYVNPYSNWNSILILKWNSFSACLNVFIHLGIFSNLLLIFFFQFFNCLKQA